MKNFKKLIVAATIVGMLGVVGVAGAASIATGATTPAEILSALTGKSVEAVTAERAEGTTYGTIAQEAGKLDEFKAENLVQKKALLDQRVKDGNLTQAEADTFYKSIETNQATCDGTSSARMGQKNGTGFRQGMGRGTGQHSGGGFGGGIGSGSGSYQQ